MRILYLIATVTAAWLVVGCSSMPATIDPGDKIDKDKGVLLAAITSDSNPRVMDAWFFYRKKGSKEEQRLDAFGVAGILYKPNDYPAQKSRIGRLVALPLQPGEYELFNWMLYIQQLGGYGYLSPKSPPPSHFFTVSPGTVTYLGNLHIDTIVGKNIFGFEIPVGGNPDILDSQETDIPLMRKKYPNLGDWPMQTSIPDGKPWKMLK